MTEHQDEIELLDYFHIFRKRKWVILIPPVLCAVAAAVLSFLLPQKWEADALIQPSKVFVRNERGFLEELVFVGPRQVASQINRESYNGLIAADLKMDIGQMPEIQAEPLWDTKLIHVFVRDRDPEKAKAILNSLSRHLKAELDGKADIEIKDIESQVEANEIEKDRTENEIKILKNKLKIARARIVELGNEMDDTRRRVETLEKEQLAALKTEPKGEAEAMAMLLYSNEIQQSLTYINTLKELLDSRKIDEENLNTEVENREKKLLQADNTIKNLNQKKGLIDATRLVKEPTASDSPVSPNKKLIVAIAFLAGLVFFTLVALFLEYIEKNEVKV
jgi:capsular polysaccharide biosynthesis protein